ncbi:MAG: hypothetical protein KZQ89_00430 [Candidatus Thiodiazotropha sp. (ex Lucinoma kastoroae)]|nr:hypothetical protein [Candidatus Thiodiazotropha sp. (ex Lucinoma kastoroae)]
MDADTTLPDLTPDDRVWRVNWLGEVAYPGHIHRYTQPCLKVILSALLCDHDDSKALLNPECSNNWETHEAWVPISSLPLLSIGSLWQNGIELASPQYQIKRFERLQINAETTTLIKAGLSLDGSFLLPLSHHPWHRGATQSYCIMITLPDNIRLIIPCMELIRFYFGSSGNLVQRLFTTPLITNSLWAKKRYNESKRHLHLVLADRMSGVSAADIGRIAASKHKAQRHYKLKKEHRFPDLVPKRVWRDKIDTLPSADIFLMKSDGSFEQISYGESNYNSSATGVDTTTQTDHEIGRLPKFVKTGLLLLDLNQKFMTAGSRKKIVAPPGKDNLVFSLPLVMDDTGEVAETFFMEAPDGGIRIRRACFVEIYRPSSHIQCVVIAEGRSWDQSPVIMSTQTLDKLQAAILLTSNAD